MLTFLYAQGFPTYLALSTDIVDNKIAGASIIGGTIYLIDTKSWLVIEPDLTVVDFNYLTVGNTMTLDPQYATLLVNNSKYAQVVASEFHYKVHVDELWSFSYLQSNIASSGTVFIGMVTGTSELHLAMSFTATGNGMIEIYYGSVAFTGGTPIATQNHNYAISSSPLTTFFLTPTISGAGTVRETFLIAGGTAGNATGGSTEFPFSREMRFPANTKFYIKYTNLDGNSVVFNAVADFYEVP